MKIIAPRKALGKKVRFEVFKRDQFTCQYCGATAPQAVLVVDHITPVAKGGGNEITNLITSCQACNSGKSDIRLSDDTAVRVAHKQAAALQERRQQIEMMAEWQRSVAKSEPEIDAINKSIYEKFGVTLNELGKRQMRKRLRKFGFSLVHEAFMIACDNYTEVEDAVSKIGGIANNIKIERDNPPRHWARKVCFWLSYCFNDDYDKWRLESALTIWLSGADDKEAEARRVCPILKANGRSYRQASAIVEGSINSATISP